MEAWEKPEAKDKPNVAKNKKRWAAARAAATKKFGSKNSYVKNMWAVKKYNSHGGEWHKSMTGDTQSDKIDWKHILNEYGKLKNVYQEHLSNLDFMNPYVFTWSETENMVMPNPTVESNDLETWDAARNAAINAKSQLIRFEKTFRWLRQTPGKMVTAETLAQMAPSGVTRDALSTALGVSEQDRLSAQHSLDVWLAQRMENGWFGKSGWNTGMEPLRKDAPFAGEHQSGPVGDDGEKDTNRWGAGEKGGMRIRWDAAHNYMKPIVVEAKWDDLETDDQEAIKTAHSMLRQEDQLESSMNDGQTHKWLVHTFLRPHQQRFFIQGLYQYTKHHENAASDRNSRWGAPARARALQRARDHVAQVERERLKIVRGDYKPFKLTDRYKHNKVQPGTIAARHILEGKDGHHSGSEIDTDSKVMIPQQGQHGPTSYDQHDNEVERQRVPRAAPGMSGAEFVEQSHSVAGIELGELHSAMKQAKLQRQQVQFRGNPPWAARQSKRVNAGLSRVTPEEWKDWKSFNRRPGETEDAFLTRKLSEFFMLKEGTPNPSSWRTVFANFNRGQIDTENGPVQVTTHMRQSVDRAAARIAVNNSVISREEEWDSLPFEIKFKYRSKVMHELHKNAFDEQYGKEHERRFAAERLRRHRSRQSVPNLFTANGPIRNRVINAGGPVAAAQVRRRPRPGDALAGVMQAAAQPANDVEPSNQIPTDAKNIEEKVVQINNQIKNLARFYVKNKKVKLGADKAIEAAEKLMAANRLYARRMKRYESAGSSLNARQKANMVRAQAEIEAARKEARAVFGGNFENEVKRALARKRQRAQKERNLLARQQQLMQLNRSFSKSLFRENITNKYVRQLRYGLAKAMVANLLKNTTIEQRRDNYVH